ncbi:MAG: hypothetical protein ACOYT8_03185 [Candidatus Dependentiae bacterium]
MKNIFNNTQEKSQLPQALITIGHGATDLAKNGLYIQAQPQVIESLNNIAGSAKILAENGILIKAPEINIVSIEKACLNTIKASCISIIGMSISLTSLCCFYKVLFHKINSEKKELATESSKLKRFMLPIISLAGVITGLLLVKNCDALI